MAEQRNTGNVIDDLKDVNKIVQAMSISTNAISKILNSVSNLGAKIDEISKIDKTIKKVNKTIVQIQSVIHVLVDSLTTMTGVFNVGDADKLNELLVDANEYALDENGKPILQDGQKIIKASRQTLPVILCKTAESIGKIIDAMGKLGNISINPIAGLKAHIYMKHIGSYLSLLVDTITKSFAGIDTKKNKNLFKILTTDPERTITKLDNNKHDWKVGENGESKSEDLSKTTTQVIKGRMGVLDIITTILNIVEKLGTLKIPNSLYLKFIVNRYASIMSSLIKDFTKEFGGLKGTDVSVLSQVADIANTVVESILSVSAMLGGPKQFIKFYIASISARLAIQQFGMLLGRIITLLNSKEFEQLKDEKYIESITTGFANIKDITNSLIEIMGKFILVSLAMIALGALVVPALIAYIPIIIFLFALKGIIKIINWLFNKESTTSLLESIENISKIALRLSAAILLLSITILTIAILGQFIEENWKTILKTFLLIGALLVIFALLGFAKEVTKEGAISILIMSASMILLSASMLLLYQATKGMTWEQFGMIFAIIGGIIGVFALAGFISASILAGAMAILAISAPLILISIALLIFINVIEKAQKLGITKATKEQIKLPIRVIESAVKAICDIGIKSILEASMKILPLLAITAGIGKMADVVQKIASLSIPTKFDKNGNPIAFTKMGPDDFELATKNISLLLTTILTAIGSDEMTKILDNLKSRSIHNVAKVLDASSGISNVLDSINKASKIDSANIAKGICGIKEAIVQYIGMINDLFVRKGELEMTTKSILGFNVPVPTYKETKAPEIDTSHITQCINSLFKISKLTTALKDVIDNITAIKIPDINDASKIKECILQYISLIGNGDNSIKLDAKWKDKIKALEKTANAIEDFANIKSDRIKETTENFVKLIDKTNTVNVDKIKSIRDMFEQMARFSESIKGDFDKLADVLSDKLVDILEKLHTTIEDMTNKPLVVPQQAQFMPVQNASAQTPQQNAKQSSVDTESLENIESILTEMSMLVKEIKENTETTSF